MIKHLRTSLFVAIMAITMQAFAADILPHPANDIPHEKRLYVMNQDATLLYVANLLSHDVYVINTATNTVVGNPIPVGQSPWYFVFGKNTVRFGKTKSAANVG